MNTGGGNAMYNGIGNVNSTTTITGGDTQIISKPTTSKTIICYKTKPEKVGMVLDAIFIKDSLTKKYQLSAK